MIAYSPTEKALDWARKECCELDRVKPNDMPNFSERRYLGFLGEWYFARWLRERGVRFSRNGGADGLPDFTIRGLGIGVKTVGARGGFTERHVCSIYERHRQTGPTRLFFVGHIGLERPTSMVMLGGMWAGDFFRRATWVPKGARINPTTIALNDVWNLAIGKLWTPDAWLEGFS